MTFVMTCIPLISMEKLNRSTRKYGIHGQKYL